MFDLPNLIASFGSLTWVVAFFLIAILIIVSVHEYGHYIVGRWCGIHADVFSIGFGPVLASRMDKHGTQWQIAAIPLGGYVKFRGDANAASSPDEAVLVAMSELEKRRTMPGAPVWARAATAAAGPVFNFVFSILLFAGLLLWNGQPQDSLKIATLQSLPTTHELQVGDEIIAVGGVAVSKGAEFAEATRALPVQPLVEYTVLRDGATMSARGPYPYTTLITNVVPNSAAIDAGVRIGDVIVGINGAPVFNFPQVQSAVSKADGNPLSLTLWSSEGRREVTLTPRSVDLPLAEGGFETVYRIGVGFGAFFEPAREAVSIGQALPSAISNTWSVITGSLSGMYHMVVGDISSCNLSGPITIAETSGQMAAMGPVYFLSLLAMISTAIGLMNLFPIPMLDGGHLLFCAYESVSGRPPSEKAMNLLMTIGMAVVFSVMIFALLNDFVCP